VAQNGLKTDIYHCASMNDQIPVSIEVLNTYTRKIIGCAFRVSNQLEPGFLEKVYENALALELIKAELKFQTQVPLKIHYEGIVVGDYIADLLIEDAILVELKAIEALNDAHFAQCLNYLKATDLKLCLLMNFGTQKVQIKRIIN
jgi:GxxExxY protein